MNKVQHLWNLINQLSSNPVAEAIGLQSYYVERCRQIENNVELPKKIFGAGTMCSYCGSLWSQIDYRVRFGSGRSPAKSVRKILNKEGKNVGKVRQTLIKKAVKNSGNKVIIRCSFCSKYTKINMTKPARLKPRAAAVESNENQTPVIKKRKKRTKDKTAGLIITPNHNSQDSNKTPKVKPTNLNKLNAMISKNLTPSKKSSLHDFITELGNT